MTAAARPLRERSREPVADIVPPPEDDPHRMICRQLKLVMNSLVRRVDLHMQPLELTGMQWEPRADAVAASAPTRWPGSRA